LRSIQFRAVTNDPPDSRHEPLPRGVFVQAFIQIPIPRRLARRYSVY
jgi:hypothetical protein